MKRTFSVFFLLHLFTQTLHAQLSADFSADSTSGCGSIAGVNFTDLSTGNPTSWLWDFGNNNTSTLQNPVANYTAPGKYTVRLTVSNGTSNDVITKTNFITVYRKPQANYTFTPNQGCAPLSVQFTNTSIAGDTSINQYIWDFGDGGKGTTRNPSHTYQIGGSFPTSLQIIDRNGCSDFITKPNINPTTPPLANFTTAGRLVSCDDSLDVDFINTSQGNNLTFKWFFGDGDSSFLTNPSHTYKGFGRYDVTLIATDPNCSDTLFFREHVRLENTKAIIQLEKKEFCYGEEVEFKSNSTGATNFSWRFGDGTTSTQENPTKIYQDSGTYVVRLLVSAGASCIRDTTDTIHVQRVIADYSMSKDVFCLLTDSIMFSNNSINYDSSKWIFEFRNQNPAIYSDKSSPIFKFRSNVFPFQLENGFYTDSLIVWSKLGCRDTLVIDSNRQINFLTSRISVVQDSLLNLEIYTDCDGSRSAINNYGGCIPLFASFTNITKGGGSPRLTKKWNISDFDSTNVDTTKVYFFNDTNIYFVDFEVENDLGCKVVDRFNIKGGTKQSPNFTSFPDTICGSNDVLFLNDLSSDTSLITKLTVTGNSGLTFVGCGFTFNPSVPIQSIKSPYKRNIQFTSPLLPLLSFFRDTGNTTINYTVSSFACDTTVSVDSAVYVQGPIVSCVDNDDRPDFLSCFKAITQRGCDERRVDFEAIMKGYTGFEWDFGDGSPVNTTDTAPTHQYLRDTVFIVTLTVYNDLNNCDTVRVKTEIRFRKIEENIIRTSGTRFCFGDSIFLFTSNTNQIIFSEMAWFLNSNLISNSATAGAQLNKQGENIIELRVKDRLGCEFVFFDTVFASKTIAQFDTTILNNCNPLRIAFNDRTTSDTLLVSWMWTFGNGDTSFTQSDTINFSEIGAYDVSLFVVDSVGCRDFVLAKEFVKIEENKLNFLSGNPSICIGDSITFRNTSDATNPQFNWDFGDGTIIANNDEFVGHRYQDTGTFTVRLFLIDNNSCLIEHVKPRLVKVEGIPSIDFTADTTDADCYPLGVNFTELSTGNINQWEWRFGNGASSILQNPFANYTRPDSFDVFLKVTTPNGCSDSILKPAFIKTRGPFAVFNIDKDTACINAPFQFEITEFKDVASFLWDFGDGNSSIGNPITHNYQRTGTIKPSLILTDSTGNCTVVLEEEIFVFEVFADFTSSVDSGCVPLRIDLNNNSMGENNFIWRLGQGNSSTERNPSTVFNMPGIYTISLEVSSENGCRDTAFKTIIARPNPTATVSDNQFICVGDSVILSAQGGIRYLWQPSEHLSAATDPTVIAFPPVTTNYLIQVFNQFNCSDSVNILVNVQQAPNFKSLKDTSLIIGETLNIDVTAGLGFIYRWTPSDGLSCDDCPNPIAQPLESKTYIVEITDSTGCFFATDTIFIEVIELFTLDVPSTFTPNGDGTNDVIFVKGAGLKELLAFKIYNRFGELVFESNDFEKGWDGTYRGKPQNIETYVYTAEALTFSGKVLTKKGNISLLR